MKFKYFLILLILFLLPKDVYARTITLEEIDTILKEQIFSDNSINIEYLETEIESNYYRLVFDNLDENETKIEFDYDGGSLVYNYGKKIDFNNNDQIIELLGHNIVVSCLIEAISVAYGYDENDFNYISQYWDESEMKFNYERDGIEVQVVENGENGELPVYYKINLSSGFFGLKPKNDIISGGGNNDIIDDDVNYNPETGSMLLFCFVIAVIALTLLIYSSYLQQKNIDFVAFFFNITSFFV